MRNSESKWIKAHQSSRKGLTSCSQEGVITWHREICKLLPSRGSGRTAKRAFSFPQFSPNCYCPGRGPSAAAAASLGSVGTGFCRTDSSRKRRLHQQPADHLPRDRSLSSRPQGCPELLYGPGARLFAGYKHAGLPDVPADRQD